VLGFIRKLLYAIRVYFRHKGTEVNDMRTLDYLGPWVAAQGKARKRFGIVKKPSSLTCIHGQGIIIIFARDRPRLCISLRWNERANQSIPCCTILAMRSERIALTYRHTLHTCPYDNSRGAHRYLLPLRVLIRRSQLPLIVFLDLIFAIL